MKTNQPIAVGQAMQALTNFSEPLPKESAVLTLAKSGKAELSIFSDTPASPTQIAVSVNKLSKAFPQTSVDFFNLLAERIVKRGISADRLEFAVDYVLDNFSYRNLTIADIMSIDRKVDVMTYSEMLSECSRRGCSTNDFSPLHIGNAEKPFWVHKSDKAKFNIPDKM